jgi:hypothetical protein
VSAENSLFPAFYTKNIVLPRQARDKHGENSKKNSQSLPSMTHPPKQASQPAIR